MFTKCLPVLLACAALLQVDAKINYKCTEVVEGSEDGVVHPQPLMLLPAWKKQHTLDVPATIDCDVSGVSVTSCDVAPAEVAVSLPALQVRLKRAAGLWLPLVVQLSVYCAAAHTSAAAANYTSADAVV